MAISSRKPHALPGGPALPGVSVTVWTVRLDAPVEFLAPAEKILSPDELTKAKSFRNDQARRNYVLAHAALRRVLGAALKTNPATIQFRNGLQGKPTLAGAATGGWEFNLTHSGDLALIAVAQGAEVGIDVERARPMSEALRLAERFFTAAEHAALRALPVTDQTAAFLNLWTRKEAFVKATGWGIMDALTRFEVSLEAEARVLSIDGDARTAAQWTLHSFHPAPGYVATAAVRSPAARFTSQEFPSLL